MRATTKKRTKPFVPHTPPPPPAPRVEKSTRQRPPLDDVEYHGRRHLRYDSPEVRPLLDKLNKWFPGIIRVTTDFHTGNTVWACEDKVWHHWGRFAISKEWIIGNIGERAGKALHGYANCVRWSSPAGDVFKWVAKNIGAEACNLLKEHMA